MRNQAIIIPALNPSESLIDYVEELLSNGFQEIIVVNDGTKQELAYIFHKLTTIPQCTVLVHESNRGKGRALKTAFQYILKHLPKLDGVITADADGQHAVNDVCRVADKLEKRQNQLVLGIRNFKEANVPTRSLIGNTITTGIYYLLFRQKLIDTQTGLRGIPLQELIQITKLKGERYEYEINMLIYANKRKIPIEEVTIETIYYNNNSGSYYNTIKDSLKIFRKLMSGFLYFNLQYKNLLEDDVKASGETHEK